MRYEFTTHIKKYSEIDIYGRPYTEGEDDSEHEVVIKWTFAPVMRDWGVALFGLTIQEATLTINVCDDGGYHLRNDQYELHELEWERTFEWDLHQEDRRTNIDEISIDSVEIDFTEHKLICKL